MKKLNEEEKQEKIIKEFCRDLADQTTKGLCYLSVRTIAERLVAKGWTKKKNTPKSAA